jgi:TP901-1 family phage major tail protein
MKMANGTDFLLYADTPEGKVRIGAQRGGSFERENEPIDVSSKDDNGWSNEAPGKNSWSLSGDGLVVENDYAQRILERKFKNRESLTVYFVTPAGIQYTGKTTITSYSIEAADGEAATYDISLQGQGEYTEIEPATLKAEIDAKTIDFNFAEGDSKDSVKLGFSLPSKGVYANSVLSFTSDNPGVLTVAATLPDVPTPVTVVRGNDDVVVKLTCTATLGTVSSVYVHELLVKGNV